MASVFARLTTFGQFSIFGKCLGMVAVTTALIAGLMTYNAGNLLKEVATAGLIELASDATQGTAGNVAGALKFGKNAAVQSALAQLVTNEGGKLVGGMAFSAAGEVRARTDALDESAATVMANLAAKARQSGRMERDPTGLIVAAPALFGEKGDVTGAVALQWSTVSLEAAYGSEQRRAILLAVGVFVALLAAGAWFLHGTLRRPLQVVAQAMDNVASADYESAIPMTARKDEVGRLAVSLDVMRHGLNLAAKDRLQREEDVALQKAVVKALTGALQRLAAGDLTARLPDDFPPAYRQLADDYNSATAQLGAALRAVIATAGKIQGEADHISRQSGNLSQRTENQAATLEETAAALDELTANVRAAATGTREVEQVVRDAQSDADQSGTVVQSAVNAMQEIETFSGQISTIIGVIDDIAFQTNLLALNAGVEAARAGEAGRGFAVVASEVRALAQRSSEAAREIKSLITGSAQQVSKGVALVGKAGEALSGIAGRVQHISGLVTGIAKGAGAQSASLNEINIGVGQLDQVTQQNAAMVQEATLASDSLSAQAKDLVDLVAVFRTNEQAAAVAPSRARASGF